MKKLVDLTFQELKVVVENNEDLKAALAKAGYEYTIGEDGDVWFCMTDCLHNFPKSGKYDISGYYDYLKLGNDYQEVVDYLRYIQDNFCFLYKHDDPEYYNRLLAKMERYAEVLEDCDYYGCINIKTKDYNCMVDFCDNAIEELEADLLRNFQAQYEYYYSDDNCVEYAMERICDNCGIYIQELGCYGEDLVVTDDLRTVFDLNDI